jgi:hypothetical protein
MEFEIGKKYMSVEDPFRRVVVCVGITIEGDPILQFNGGTAFWSVNENARNRYRLYQEPERKTIYTYHIRFAGDSMETSAECNNVYHTYQAAIDAGKEYIRSVVGIVKATLILEDYFEEPEEE